MKRHLSASCLASGTDFRAQAGDGGDAAAAAVVVDFVFWLVYLKDIHAIESIKMDLTAK